MLFSVYLTCLVLVVTNAIGSSSKSSMSTSELFAKLKQEAGHLFTKNDDACTTVPAPTNGRVIKVGSSSATLQFDWEDKEGNCPDAMFSFVLYQKGIREYRTLGASTQEHLRGFAYKQLKSGQEYYVDVFAANDNEGSANLTIAFTTKQVPQSDEDSVFASPSFKLYYKENQARRECSKVDPIKNEKATDITASSATVSFDWTSIDGECDALFFTGLKDAASDDVISITASYSNHFRAQLYTNLLKDTAYGEHTAVIANNTLSPTVVTLFRTTK